jgi:hypothetical protein
VLEQGIEQFKEFRQLLLVGPQPPVAYFSYPEKKSVFTSPDYVIHRLANPGEDYIGALDALAETLSMRDQVLTTDTAERPPMPTRRNQAPGTRSSQQS